MSKRVAKMREETKRICLDLGFKAHLDSKLALWKTQLSEVCEAPGSTKKKWTLSLISRGRKGKFSNVMYWPFCHPRQSDEWKIKGWDRAKESVIYICSADSPAELYPPGTITQQLELFGFAFVISPTVEFAAMPNKLHTFLNSRKWLVFLYGCSHIFTPQLYITGFKDQLPKFPGIETTDLDDKTYVHQLLDKRLDQDIPSRVNYRLEIFDEKLERLQKSYLERKEKTESQRKYFVENILARPDKLCAKLDPPIEVTEK